MCNWQRAAAVSDPPGARALRWQEWHGREPKERDARMFIRIRNPRLRRTRRETRDTPAVSDATTTHTLRRSPGVARWVVPPRTRGLRTADPMPKRRLSSLIRQQRPSRGSTWVLHGFAYKLVFSVSIQAGASGNDGSASSSAAGGNRAVRLVAV